MTATGYWALVALVGTWAVLRLAKPGLRAEYLRQVAAGRERDARTALAILLLPLRLVQVAAFVVLVLEGHRLLVER